MFNFIRVAVVMVFFTTTETVIKTASYLTKCLLPQHSESFSPCLTAAQAGIVSFIADLQVILNS